MNEEARVLAVAYGMGPPRRLGCVVQDLEKYKNQVIEARAMGDRPLWEHKYLRNALNNCLPLWKQDWYSSYYDGVYFTLRDAWDDWARGRDDAPKGTRWARDAYGNKQKWPLFRAMLDVMVDHDCALNVYLDEARLLAYWEIRSVERDLEFHAIKARISRSSGQKVRYAKIENKRMAAAAMATIDARLAA